MELSESLNLTCAVNSEHLGLVPAISLSSVIALLSLIGLFGNALVILTVLYTKNMRTATNCYLVSLAISDSIFFITTMPAEIHDLFIPYRYDFGYIGCALQIFLSYLCMNASSLSVAAFSVERYIGICDPMRARYLCTVKRAVRIVACMWSFSVLYNSPWLYFAKHLTDQSNCTSKCGFRFDRTSAFYQAIYIGDIFVFYVLPVVLYIFLYTRIAICLQKRLPQATNHASSKGNPKSDFNRTSKRTNQNDRNGHQVVKMLAVVTCVFATLWLPYKFVVVFNSFAPSHLQIRSELFFISIKVCVFINAAINPVLYSVMSCKFRQAFKQMLLFKRRSQRRDTYLPNQQANPAPLPLNHANEHTELLFENVALNSEHGVSQSQEEQFV